MSKSKELPIDKKLGNEFNKLLRGKTIQSVRYMTDEEVENFMWYRKALIIIFTDGSYLIPQRDDEGNDAGSLFLSDKGNEHTLCVI